MLLLAAGGAKKKGEEGEAAGRVRRQARLAFYPLGQARRRCNRCRACAYHMNGVCVSKGIPADIIKTLERPSLLRLPDSKAVELNEVLRVCFRALRLCAPCY